MIYKKGNRPTDIHVGMRLKEDHDARVATVFDCVETPKSKRVGLAFEGGWSDRWESHAYLRRNFRLAEDFNDGRPVTEKKP